MLKALRPRKILAVNFGADRLTASVFDAKFRTVRHVKSIDVALPEKKAERADFIVETFGNWKQEYSPAGVVIGLPLRSFSHHAIDMPEMKKPDMQRALLFELEKYLPLPVDEYLFDFIPAPPEKGRTKVFVLSVKRDLVTDILKSVREAGVEILSVRCGAVESLSGFLDVCGEKSVEGLFVNVTDDAFEIAGMKKSVPLYVKSIAKNLDPVTEIERLSALYPGPVYFMGNVDPSLSARFNGRKFQIPLVNLLALSAGRRPRLKMDFLPREFVGEKKDYYPYIVGGFAVAAVVLFVLTGTVAYIKTLEKLNSVEASRAALKKRAAGVIDVRKKLDVFEGDRKVLFTFMGKSNMVIKVITDLSEALPKDVWLINFSADDKGKIEIEGFTKKTADLVSAIDKSGNFKNISFSAPIVSKEGEEHFSLKLEAAGR